MKPRIFLDTPVFIYGHEYPDSNSAVVIDLVNRNEVEAVISEQVVKEVVRYFEKFYDIETARLFRRYLFEACLVIPRQEVLEEMEKYREKIKEKDLEQLTVAKKLGIKHLISVDRDFNPFEEYSTPQQFLALLGKKSKDTNY